MIDNVILTDTKADEWPRIRAILRDRIMATMGQPGFPFPTDKAEYKIIGQYEKDGLTHVKLKYHVLGDDWNEAIGVLPPKGSPMPAPGILAIHGTNGALGKTPCVEPSPGNNEPYAFELAKRGYAAFAADQFTFGATIAKKTDKELIKDFYKVHPAWTLDGRWLYEQMRMLDVMQQLTQWVKPGEIGVVGNSLGARTVIHLAALDERVKAAMCSAGISPNCTNVYRRVTWTEIRNPILSKSILDTFGQMPWDYNEAIALCAPRALLLIEPFNDDYNPDVNTTFACFTSASKVYKLLGKPEKLSTLVHGEGHGTGPELRVFAYDWFNRHLAR